MLLHKTDEGDSVYIKKNTLVVNFGGKRRTLSTSVLNGGVCEDLSVVFNHRILPEDCDPSNLPGGSVKGYLELVVSELGISAKASGLLTAAKMENAAIRTSQFCELQLTAIVTAGVDENGGRAGDPAFYYETNGVWKKIAGTINILLLVNGSLPPATMLQAAITATEAKAAALSELMAPSKYSRGIATGSGTDGIIIASTMDNRLKFTDAGKHSKLGELIGSTVKEGVKEALFKETGLCAERQCSLIARLTRYGVGFDDFWSDAKAMGIEEDKDKFESKFEKLNKEEKLVSLAAAYIHLLDEYEWGLLSKDAVLAEGSKIIKQVSDIDIDLEEGENLFDFMNRRFIRAVNTIYKERT